MKDFREMYLLKILEEFDLSSLPLDVFLSKFFRAHKSIGSKDRSFICETLYSLIRWKGLLDHLCDKPLTWKKRFDALQAHDLKKIIHDESIPAHIRVASPKHFLKASLNLLVKKKP